MEMPSDRGFMSHALITQSSRSCTEQIHLQQMAILCAAVIIEWEPQMPDVTLQTIDAVRQSKPVDRCSQRGPLVYVGSCKLATSQAKFDGHAVHTISPSSNAHMCRVDISISDPPDERMCNSVVAMPGEPSLTHACTGTQDEFVIQPEQASRGLCRRFGSILKSHTHSLDFLELTLTVPHKQSVLWPDF